jgi:uncharacterized phiE125 gp8 family phage protein
MQFELAPFDLPADYAEAIVSLDAIKAHLQIPFEELEFDELITVYRDAAVDMVERYCELMLARREDVTWRGEMLCSPLRLGAGPVTAINSITWLDDQGMAILGAEDDWRIVRRDTIALKPGRALPSGIAAGVEIMFDAGFTDDNRPAALVQAVKMFAAHLFLHREAVLTGTISGEIPQGFRQLCAKFRVPVL